MSALPPKATSNLTTLENYKNFARGILFLRASRILARPPSLVILSGPLLLDRPGRWEAAVGHWFVSLFSTDSTKDRTVTNVRRLAVFLQPLGHFTTDR